MQRYVLHRSAIFDDPKRIYDYENISHIVKKYNGKYIRKVFEYGWKNQPKVIAFNSTSFSVKKILKELKEKLPAFQNTIAEPCIYEKNW